MESETINIKNRSGTDIIISFDSKNIIQDGKGVGLRIPVQIGKYSRAVVMEAPKTLYPNVADFLERVEQFGKAYIAKWLETSSDHSVSMPFPDTANGWTVGFEPVEDPNA